MKLPNGNLQFQRSDYVSIGLGYYSDENDYVVVKIVNLWSTKYLQCEIFSLNKNSWTVVNPYFTDITAFHLLKKPVCIKDRVCWLLSERYPSYHRSNAILTYDMATKVLRKTVLPEELRMCNILHPESLRLISWDKEMYITLFLHAEMQRQIWVLNDDLQCEKIDQTVMRTFHHVIAWPFGLHKNGSETSLLVLNISDITYYLNPYFHPHQQNNIPQTRYPMNGYGYGYVDVHRQSLGLINTKDGSDRDFYKELIKVIDASDVIVEVLDARDPLGMRCIDMEKMVMKSSPYKHLVLLLNKIDLIPREAVEKWLTYFRDELPAVAFKCSTQEQKSNSGPSNLLQTSYCLGAETLLKLLKNYSRSHEIKKSITVGIVGLPNAGKSSLINSLKRFVVKKVVSTPGLARSLQEVQLDDNVKLLDCPGVVMLKSTENDASIALRNGNQSTEKLEDPISPGKIPYFTMPPARIQQGASDVKLFQICIKYTMENLL